MAQWKVSELRRVKVEQGSPAYLLFPFVSRTHVHTRVCMLSVVAPAIKLRRIRQRKLIPSALHCLMSQGANWRHIGTQFPLVLPGLRQVHTSPSRMAIQDLDVASLVKTFANQVPCEAELCFSRHGVALFCRPLIPSTEMGWDEISFNQMRRSAWVKIVSFDEIRARWIRSRDQEIKSLHRRGQDQTRSED